MAGTPIAPDSHDGPVLTLTHQYAFYASWVSNLCLCQRAKQAKAKSTNRKEPAIEIPQQNGFDVSELKDFYDVGSSETSQAKVLVNQRAVHGQGDQQSQPRESLGMLQPANPFKIPESTTKNTNTSLRLSTDHQSSQFNPFKIPESTSEHKSSRLCTDRQDSSRGLDREHG